MLVAAPERQGTYTAELLDVNTTAGSVVVKGDVAIMAPYMLSTLVSLMAAADVGEQASLSNPAFRSSLSLVVDKVSIIALEQRRNVACHEDGEVAVCAPVSRPPRASHTTICVPTAFIPWDIWSLFTLAGDGAAEAWVRTAGTASERSA